MSAQWSAHHKYFCEPTKYMYDVVDLALTFHQQTRIHHHSILVRHPIPPPHPWKSEQHHTNTLEREEKSLWEKVISYHIIWFESGRYIENNTSTNKNEKLKTRLHDYPISSQPFLRPHINPHHKHAYRSSSQTLSHISSLATCSSYIATCSLL
jgi:hypothetical protein